MGQRRHEYTLNTMQRRVALWLGAVFLASAGAMLAVLGRGWWLLSALLALASLHYLRVAWRGRVTADEDAPAPPWLRERILRSRLLAWLVSRWRPPAV
jgi:hypothetical protein